MRNLKLEVYLGCGHVKNVGLVKLNIIINGEEKSTCQLTTAWGKKETDNYKMLFEKIMMRICHIVNTTDDKEFALDWIQDTLNGSGISHEAISTIIEEISTMY